MTLNGVIAFILRYFTEFDSFAGRLCHSEDRPIMSAKYRLPVTFGQNWLTQQLHGLSAIAKFLVMFVIYEAAGLSLSAGNEIRLIDIKETCLEQLW